MFIVYSTAKEAIKAGKLIEIERDLYLTDDNRILHYDRYYGRSGRTNMWVDDEGRAYTNFESAYRG